MARYEIVQIICGVETVLLDTTDAARTKRIYRKFFNEKRNVRLRVNGDILSIHEADEFVVINENAVKANTGRPRPRNKNAGGKADGQDHTRGCAGGAGPA